LFILPLARYAYYPFEIKPYGEQPYYYPDPDGNLYWGILEKGESRQPPPWA
jgi:hypothetical protein